MRFVLAVLFTAMFAYAVPAAAQAPAAGAAAAAPPTQADEDAA
jgi:hypothetical protein